MIAASIVTFNTSLDELQTCLDCVYSCPHIARVDVIDNSSNKAIEEFIGRCYPDAIYTASNNIGYGAANNISITKSLLSDKIEYHLVLNTDIKFSSETMEILLNKMDSDSAIGLIMPAVIGRDNRPQSCCHPLPSPADLIIHRFAPRNCFKNWRRRYDILPQTIAHDLDVPYMHGCFMLFRVDALRKIGLFDERFFMYPEDIDITRRIHAHYKTVVTPDATIFHLHRAASKRNFRMFLIHVSNMLRYFSKWGFFQDSERKEFNRRLKRDLM